MIRSPTAWHAAQSASAHGLTFGVALKSPQTMMGAAWCLRDREWQASSRWCSWASLMSPRLGLKSTCTLASTRLERAGTGEEGQGGNDGGQRRDEKSKEGRGRGMVTVRLSPGPMQLSLTINHDKGMPCPKVSSSLQISSTQTHACTRTPTRMHPDTSRTPTRLHLYGIADPCFARPSTVWSPPYGVLPEGPNYALPWRLNTIRSAVSVATDITIR